jgi:hypothetical protein
MRRVSGERWLSAIVITTCAGVLSCRKSDADMPKDITNNKLRQIADAVASSVANGAMLNEKETLNDPKSLLLAAYDRGAIPEGEARDRVFEFDGWGNPFAWSSKEDLSGSIAVRILSRGSNGLLENGRGDDLWLDLEIDLKRRTVGKASTSSSGKGTPQGLNGQMYH